MENQTTETRPENPYMHEAREHARAASREMRKTLEAWMPPGVVTHQRAARREFLLAVRSMINAAIDKLEREEAGKKPNETKTTTV